MAQALRESKTTSRPDSWGNLGWLAPLLLQADFGWSNDGPVEAFLVPSLERAAPGNVGSSAT